MKKVLFTLSIIAIAITACQDLSPVEKPEQFIPEQEMEEIMYEAMLLRAARGYNIGQLTSKGIDPQTYVLKKYDIDSVQYAANTAYYAAQLQTYTAMNTRIQKRVLAVLKIEDSLNKIEKKIKDSLRLIRNREREEERLAKIKKDSLEGADQPSTTGWSRPVSDSIGQPNALY